MKLHKLSNGNEIGNIISFKKKNYFLLVDTETVNNDRIIVEFSGMIINNNMIAQKRFSYIIKEVWESQSLMSGIYASQDKKIQWSKSLENGTSELVSIHDLVDKVNNLIKEYNLNILIAYNVGFDKDAYDRTLKHFDIYANKVQFLKVLDIWYYASILFISKTYVDFCVKNDFITPNGNCKTSAETMYRYLSYQYNFIETHIAKDDIEIELDILRSCVFKDHRPIIGVKQKPIWYIKPMKKYLK